MRIVDHSRPVVVLRGVRHGGLGIARSLGRLGVPVYFVDPSAATPAFYSRYTRGSFRFEVESAPAEQAVAFLREVARRVGGRPLLIPTTDSSSMLVADHAGSLRDCFLFPNRDAHLVRSLCSKKEMYFLAKKCGVPTAETAFPQSRRDVLDYLETARFPIMLKGIYGKRLKTVAGKPMFIVRTARELLEQYAALEDPGEPNLMLQEYIPGGDDTIWMFNGYFNANSECLAGFTGRKIRQCPVYTGPTSLGVCLENETVDRTTREFMRAIGYTGVLDIGYRYDARDGRYKVLDVNPRIGASFRLFVGRNELDVARALYLDMTGQAVPCDRLREGRKWIVEDCDVVSCFNYFKDGKLALRPWLQSYRRIEEGGLWAPDDPWPVWHMLLADAREGLHRVSSVARDRFRPAQRARAAAAPGVSQE